MVPGVAEEQLGRIPLAVVVRANHPLALADGLVWSDLAAFPSAQPFDHLGQIGQSGALICENFDVLREVVKHTDCIWLVSPILIRAELDAGELVMLNLRDMPISETLISLVYLRGRTRSPVSMVLQAAATELIADISRWRERDPNGSSPG
jgi:DNA-binding transcriptional LysR family regulator